MNRNRCQSLFAASTVAILLSLCSAECTFGETWSDKSVKFQVEAEYVGVEGRSVVLQKASGQTAKVPIDRLSDESRARARRLYEFSKSNTSVGRDASQSAWPSRIDPNSGDHSSSLRRRSGSLALNFKTPEPPPVAPMPKFPENASLQATFDFVVTQLRAGHPEVLWHSLPTEFREAVDSQEMRMADLQSRKAKDASLQQLVSLAMKAVEILVTKKQFVMNTPMMDQFPPTVKPLINRGYDPAVGAIFELVMTVACSTEEIEHMTVTEILDRRGPRVGGHLRSLLKLAPHGLIDTMLSQVTIEQSSDTTAFVISPKNTGGKDRSPWVKSDGRSVPKWFAEGWAESKEDLKNVLYGSKPDGEAKQVTPEMTAIANAVLDPLLAANSQEEFDTAVMQAIFMTQMITSE